MAYIAFLRGINVTGYKIIKMDALRKIFEDAGFKNVRTYIQSGNVIFETNKDENLQKRIEAQLKKELGYEVVTIVRSIEELKRIIKENPYKNLNLTENERLHLTMLEVKPTGASVKELLSVKSDIDELKVKGKEVYLICRNGYGRSVYSNNLIEKKLGMKATTRNWNTINRILTI